MGVALNGAYIDDDSSDYVSIRAMCPPGAVSNYQRFVQYTQRVDAIDPTGGPTEGGTVVTVRGAGFLPIDTPDLVPPLLAPSRRDALALGLAALATATMPPRAALAATGAPSEAELTKLAAGYARLQYLADHFEQETTVCVKGCKAAEGIAGVLAPLLDDARTHIVLGLVGLQRAHEFLHPVRVGMKRVHAVVGLVDHRGVLLRDGVELGDADVHLVETAGLLAAGFVDLARELGDLLEALDHLLLVVVAAALHLLHGHFPATIVTRARMRANSVFATATTNFSNVGNLRL